MSSGTSYGGGMYDDVLGDHENVKKHAKHHGGDSEDRGIFDSALSAIQGNASRLQGQGVDEHHAVNAHKKYYGGGGGDNSSEPATTSGMGSAAAMQALKMFSGGSSSSSSGGSQEFMGMAMGQAAKLFDSQAASGNVSSNASKQGVVQEAGEMALKMYMQSQMGGSSGGSSGLMSLASKFM